MMELQLPVPVQRFIEEHAHGDRWTAMALHALICASQDDGDVPFNAMAIQYRNDYLGMVRDEGRDADREAGRLGLDEVREHLTRTVLPRLAQDGLVKLPAGQIGSDTVIQIEPTYWSQLAPFRQEWRGCSSTPVSTWPCGPERAPAACRSRTEACWKLVLW